MGRKPVAGCLYAVEALVYGSVPDVDFAGLPRHDAVCHAAADTAVPDNNVVGAEQLDAQQPTVLRFVERADFALVVGMSRDDRPEVRLDVPTDRLQRP